MKAKDGNATLALGEAPAEDEMSAVFRAATAQAPAPILEPIRLGLAARVAAKAAATREPEPVTREEPTREDPPASSKKCEECGTPIKSGKRCAQCK
jgi:hypothetical protein